MIQKKHRIQSNTTTNILYLAENNYYKHVFKKENSCQNQ